MIEPSEAIIMPALKESQDKEGGAGKYQHQNRIGIKYNKKIKVASIAGELFSLMKTQMQKLRENSQVNPTQSCNKVFFLVKHARLLTHVNRLQGRRHFAVRAFAQGKRRQVL